MCGRYLTPDAAALEREWSSFPRDFHYVQSFNFAPTQNGPVAVQIDGTRSIESMTWGFRPHWATKRDWINARSETVFESRAFGPAILRQRCLVIAAGWYEWTGVQAPKQPYLFRRSDGRSFAFAGIWTAGKESNSYAILTAPANELAARIHNRMPLIVNPDAYDAWLSPDSDRQNFEAIVDNPYGDGGLELHPVSKAVNSPKNNSPELLQRVAV